MSDKIMEGIIVICNTTPWSELSSPDALKVLAVIQTAAKTLIRE